MIPLRQVYDATPAFIPVPEALRHHRVVATFLSLDAEPSNQGQRRRVPLLNLPERLGSWAM